MSLPTRSKRRQSEAALRARVRAEVIARDRGCVAHGMAGVPCGTLPGRAALEVDELAGGQRRHETYLLADWCQALCPASHDWKTANPMRAERYGLRLPSWSDDSLLLEAALIRSVWSAGLVPEFYPSWFSETDVLACRAIEARLG